MNPRHASLLALTGSALLSLSCSVQSLVVDRLGDALAAQGTTFSGDADPELVRDALPFALKTMEALLETAPEDPELLLANCRSFTQYSKGFVEGDADMLEWDDWEAASRGWERAIGLYLRARDYGMRGLELDSPGFGDAVLMDPDGAVLAVELDQIEFLYWTAAAWGSAISLGLDRPELLADVDPVRAMLRRVLELDESYGNGAIHEALISIECLGALMGGSEDRARDHFDRAVELSEGKSASPYVTLADSGCVRGGDPAEFRRLLEAALAIDLDGAPDIRLQNTLAQRRAAFLLDNADELFLEPLD